MEKAKISLSILLLAMLIITQNQNLFTGLNLDPNLLAQASAAIVDLNNTLNANIDCRPSVPSLWGGFNLRRSQQQDWKRRRYLRQEYLHHDFKSICGFSGFHSIAPRSKCGDRNQQNKINQQIKRKIDLALSLLIKVRDYLIKYNNIVLGDNNKVNGTNNFVVGSRNSLTGNNDWVFASDYKSQAGVSGVIVITQYLIEIDDIDKILINPSEAIHCIKQQESNQHFKNFWNRAEHHRRMCF